MSNEENKITYKQFGFHSAQLSQSMPQAIEGYLAKVYERFLEEQKLDEQGLKDRISKLKAEVQQEKAKKNDANGEVSSNKLHKGDKEKQIEELQLEKISIKTEGVELGGTSEFVIGAFISLLLTLYLFVFYSSSGYSAFFGVKPGTLGFLNPNVFSDAKSPGAMAFIVLFPVIFLGLGFLIHNALETNKKLASQNKPKSYSLIACLLFVTLIADMFVGYKITQGVHANDFNAGKTDEMWRFEMVFLDINFYLVLILGFVVYVIWGFLLNYVLGHHYLKTENEQIKLLIENINNKISEKLVELSEITSKIHKLESDVATCDNKIEEKEKDIIGYQNGVIPINVASLSASVGEFMGGWQQYTHGNFNSDVALRLNTEAIRAQENWLENKIQNLNAEY